MVGSKILASEMIAHFVTEVKPGDIPQEAYRIAKMGITDCIGVSFPGSLDRGGQIITEFVRNMGGTPEAGVIGGGFKTSPYLAALANGDLSHALDYDDGTQIVGPLHPSVVLVPPALALGQSIGASGLDVLTAYIVGFESAAALGELIGPKLYEQGWHGTGTFGSLAASMVAARMLKLDCRQTMVALGIAGSLASGLIANFGTMAKPLHGGHACANGVMAARLAQAGFTACEDIMEAPLGFAKVFGYREDVDWEKQTRNLGKTFGIVNKGLLIKPWPSCAGTHCGIDDALYLRKEHGLDPDDIVDVELTTSPSEARALRYHRPTTPLEAKFSMEYCVARALLDGAVVLQSFTPDAIDEPRVRSLLKRIRHVEGFPVREYGQGVSPQRVSVKLKNGKSYSRQTDLPRGRPGNPLSQSEFEAKYRDCASLVLSESDVKHSLELLMKLESLPSIGELMEIIEGTSLCS